MTAVANMTMVVKGDSPLTMKAPKSRTIHRSSTCDDDDSELGSVHSQNLEAGLSFFDSFQEPRETRNQASSSFDGSLDDNNAELVINDAVSGALVGECVLDSPNSERKTRQIDMPPPSTSSSLSTLSEPISISVGFVSQGLSWIRSQREERRRRYLQYQAEEQALKIREAQLAESTSSPSWNNSGTKSLSQRLVGNSTFKNIANVLSSNSTGACGQDLGACADSTDVLFEQIDYGQLTDDIIQKTGLSCSGKGYMVEFAVPDGQKEDANWVPTVRIEMEQNLSSAPYLLNLAQRQQIAQQVLPSGIVYAKWKRLYSLARDGDSFEACLRLLAGHAKTLMVVRTACDEILGGFADTAWDHPTVGGNQYFGGTTSCIYRFTKNTCKSVSPEGENDATTLKVYNWTGKNRYIQLCDVQHKMLAFGGGGDDGAFGLCVAHDFQHGSSGSCDTFNNEPLASTHGNFGIVDLEIYCFLLGQF